MDTIKAFLRSVWDAVWPLPYWFWPLVVAGAGLTAAIYPHIYHPVDPWKVSGLVALSLGAKFIQDILKEKEAQKRRSPTLQRLILQSILRLFSQHVSQGVGSAKFDACLMVPYSDEKLRVVQRDQDIDRRPVGSFVPIGITVVGLCPVDRKALWVHDLDDLHHATAAFRDKPYKAILAVPILDVDGKFVAAYSINIHAKMPKDLLNSDEMMAKLKPVSDLFLHTLL